MLVFGLTQPDVINKVVADGGDLYTARPFNTGGDIQSSTLPLVMLETTQPSAESAKKTIELASANADPIFRKIQREAGVPDSMLAQTVVASPPVPPRAGTPSRTKSTLAVILAGTGAAVLAAVLVDSILLRRRIPRPSEAHFTADPGDSWAHLSTEEPPDRVDDRAR
jgi:hypothetical protein